MACNRRSLSQTPMPTPATIKKYAPMRATSIGASAAMISTGIYSTVKVQKGDFKVMSVTLYIRNDRNFLSLS